MNKIGLIIKYRSEFEEAVKQLFFRYREESIKRRLCWVANSITKLYNLFLDSGSNSEEAREKYDKGIKFLKELNKGYDPRDIVHVFLAIACDRVTGKGLGVYDLSEIDNYSVKDINRPIVITTEQTFAEFLNNYGYDIFSDDVSNIPTLFTENLLRN